MKINLNFNQNSALILGEHYNAQGYPCYTNFDRRYPSYAICHPSYASYFDGTAKDGTPLPLEMNPSYSCKILE